MLRTKQILQLLSDGVAQNRICSEVHCSKRLVSAIKKKAIKKSLIKKCRSKRFNPLPSPISVPNHGLFMNSKCLCKIS